MSYCFSLISYYEQIPYSNSLTCLSQCSKGRINKNNNNMYSLINRSIHYDIKKLKRLDLYFGIS